MLFRRSLAQITALGLLASCVSSFVMPSGYNARKDIRLFVSTLPNEKSNVASKNDDTPPLIVPFGGSAQPQDNLDKHILGGKGLGLQTMSKIGVDVPPGFTLTTTVSQLFQEEAELPSEIWEQVKNAVARVEKDMGKGYGDASNPLLFSCRSGAAVSMPGMLDTVLNIVRKNRKKCFFFFLLDYEF